MRTKRTNLNQEGGEDEGQYAEHSRSYRGIGGGHRGNQEKLEARILRTRTRQRKGCQ